MKNKKFVPTKPDETVALELNPTPPKPKLVTRKVYHRIKEDDDMKEDGAYAYEWREDGNVENKDNYANNLGFKLISEIKCYNGFLHNEAVVFRGAFIRPGKITLCTRTAAWCNCKQKLVYKIFTRQSITFSFISGKLNVYKCGYNLNPEAKRNIRFKKFGPLNITNEPVGAYLQEDEIRVLADWVNKNGYPKFDLSFKVFTINHSKKIHEDTTLKWLKTQGYNITGAVEQLQAAVTNWVRTTAYPVINSESDFALYNDKIRTPLSTILRSGRIRDVAQYFFGAHGAQANKAIATLLNTNGSVLGSTKVVSENSHQRVEKIIKSLLALKHWKDILPPQDIANIFLDDINKIPRLLQAETSQRVANHSVAKTKEFLLAHSLTRRREWFFFEEIQVLYDTANMWIELGKPKIKPEAGIQRIHDALMVEVKRRHYPNKVIEPAFEEFAVNDLLVKPLESIHECVAWGEAMNNCIASYATRAEKKDIVLGAVCHKDGGLLANFMIREQKLVQFFGKHNQRVPYIIFDSVMPELDNKKISYYNEQRDVRYRDSDVDTMKPTPIPNFSMTTSDVLVLGEEVVIAPAMNIFEEVEW